MSHRRSAALLLSALVVAGCAQPVVEVTPPAPAGSAADTCRALDAAWPNVLFGFERRSTEPPSPFVAAWGNDALVIARCGVPRPAALTPASEILEVNGIDWFVETFERGTVFTTVGRVVDLQVRVPLELRPEARVLTEMAEVIDRVVPIGNPVDATTP